MWLNRYRRSYRNESWESAYTVRRHELPDIEEVETSENAVIENRT